MRRIKRGAEGGGASVGSTDAHGHGGVFFFSPEATALIKTTWPEPLQRASERASGDTRDPGTAKRCDFRLSR